MSSYTDKRNLTSVPESSGNNTHTLTRSTVTGNVNLGGGDDTVSLLDDSHISGWLKFGEDDNNLYMDSTSSIGGSINTTGYSVTFGSGKDVVSLSGSASIASGVSLSSGNDEFSMSGGSVGGNVDLGSGTDDIAITGGTITGDLIGSWGEDDISISNATITGSVFGGRGYYESQDGVDTISISNTTIGGDINGDAGNDSITLSGVTLTGTAYGGDGSDSFVISSLSSNIVIDGNEDSGDGDVDTIDFSALTGTIVYDESNPENGVFTETATGYTVTFTNIENKVDPIVPIDPITCFTSGSKILTPKGYCKIDNLKVGDMVNTLDSGPREVLWIGTKKLTAEQLRNNPDLYPVEVKANSLDDNYPPEDTMVSPQHRILSSHNNNAILFGKREVLIASKFLCHKKGVSQKDDIDGVTYIHLLFDKHEIVCVDGLWSESFLPGEDNLNNDDTAELNELQKLFPEKFGLREMTNCIDTARIALNRWESRVAISHFHNVEITQ